LLLAVAAVVETYQAELQAVAAVLVVIELEV
jgi:hypothetical protein